jgi:HAD superfamily hydrolase (TIGR01509 family)
VPEPLHVFLDFDETLSDMPALGRQYVGRASVFLAAEFGGDPAEWAPEVVQTLTEMMERYTEAFAGNPLGGYVVWMEAEMGRAAGDLLRRRAVMPRQDETPAQLAYRVQRMALSECDALFPGAVEAVRELRERGARVHLASAHQSLYLADALRGTGLEPLVETLFGPDLVDCAKEGPEYYRRVFATCGIRPDQAVVVDDQPVCLDWAEEAGARVIQACLRPDSVPEFPTVLRALPDLPALLDR